VSIGAFMLVLMVGAALLALWLSVRMSRFEPQRLGSFVAALVGGIVVIGAVPELIPFVGRPLGPFAAVFLVVLPACTYVFLLALWLLARFGRLLRPF
jgi:hypothetical protein